MFNELIKTDFLKTVEGASYLEMFKITSEKENELSKDLYDFNMQEILATFNVKDQSTLRLIAEYFDWAINQGYKKNNVNPIYVSLLEDDEVE